MAPRCGRYAGWRGRRRCGRRGHRRSPRAWTERLGARRSPSRSARGSRNSLPLPPSHCPPHPHPPPTGPLHSTLIHAYTPPPPLPLHTVAHRPDSAPTPLSTAWTVATVAATARRPGQALSVCRAQHGWLRPVRGRPGMPRSTGTLHCTSIARRAGRSSFLGGRLLPGASCGAVPGGVGQVADGAPPGAPGCPHPLDPMCSCPMCSARPAHV